MLLVLALDPSISCTGYAAIRDDGSEHGSLVRSGKITGVRGGNIPPGNKVCRLADEVRALVAALAPDVMAVETPAQSGMSFGGFRNRAIMSAPIYGMAVGAVVAVCGTRMASSGGELREYPSDGWAMHTARRFRLPGTLKDPKKTARVELACRLYGCQPKDFGAKSVAGNVADAILLARHCLLDVRAERAAGSGVEHG